jgi:hypothetical protein
MTRNSWRKSRWAAGAMALSLASPVLAVDYANITVTDGVPQESGVPTVSVPAGQKTAGFNIDAGAVVGEYPIRIGASAADDAAGGVLISSVSEFEQRSTSLAGERLYATTSVVADDDATSTNTRNASGGLAIVTDRAGSNVAAGSLYPVGAPWNSNVAAAYFAFADGWRGQSATGVLNNASIVPDFYGVGDNLVAINGVADSRRQGILFSTTAVNKNNFSVVTANANGTGWNVTTRGNEQNGGDAETDPVSFVFMPFGTPNVTMATIFGNTGQNFQPYALRSSGSPFTVTSFTEPAPDGAAGTQTKYRLSITGESPTSGTLILQSSGNLDGDSGNPADNAIFYKADGNDWIIISDDLPTANGAGQSGATGERQPHFQFAFLPFDAPSITPGPLPALNWTKNSVFGYNVVVTELDGADNDNNDGTVGQYTTVTSGTPGIEFYGLRTNLGDNSISADGALPVGSDGTMFATISEHIRINSGDGNGLDGYGTMGVSMSGDAQTWEVHNGAADPGAGEMNVNFAAVHFGATSGFQMGTQVAVNNTTGLTVNLAGVDSASDGVLMAVNYGNDYQFETVTPDGAGGWRIDNYNDSTGKVAGDVNWVYLPYTTTNLVAGQVNADGTLASSTDTANFTLTTETVNDAFGSHFEYVLTVNGRTPDQGMLLLNAIGEGDGIDNHMAYAGVGNSFRIRNLDMTTTTEEAGGELVEAEAAPFQFAFIDFVTPPTLNPGGNFLEADFDEDGDVDGTDLATLKSNFGAGNAGGDTDEDGDTDGADFLTWQRQVGTTPPASAAAGAVPEPASIALVVMAGIAVAAARRKY